MIGKIFSWFFDEHKSKEIFRNLKMTVTELIEQLKKDFRGDEKILWIDIRTSSPWVDGKEDASKFETKKDESK